MLSHSTSPLEKTGQKFSASDQGCPDVQVQWAGFYWGVILQTPLDILGPMCKADPSQQKGPGAARTAGGSIPTAGTEAVQMPAAPSQAYFLVDSGADFAPVLIRSGFHRGSWISVDLHGFRSLSTDSPTAQNGQEVRLD
jgi:hypothetical protein